MNETERRGKDTNIIPSAIQTRNHLLKVQGKIKIKIKTKV